MDIKFNMDSAKVTAKLGRYVHEKQRALDEQVAKDSTPFVPMRDGNIGGTLSNSVQKSNFGSGQIKWETPYARRMYYGVNYNFNNGPKAPHSQATHHWFEKAKSIYKKDWIRMMNK